MILSRFFQILKIIGFLSNPGSGEKVAKKHYWYLYYVTHISIYPYYTMPNRKKREKCETCAEHCSTYTVQMYSSSRRLSLLLFFLSQCFIFFLYLHSIFSILLLSADNSLFFLFFSFDLDIS